MSPDRSRFGYHRPAGRLGRGNYSRSDRPVDGQVGQAFDEASIDLDDVEGHVLEVVEPAIAGTEVVDRTGTGRLPGGE